MGWEGCQIITAIEKISNAFYGRFLLFVGGPCWRGPKRHERLCVHRISINLGIDNNSRIALNLITFEPPLAV